MVARVDQNLLKEAGKLLDWNTGGTAGRGWNCCCCLLRPWNSCNSWLKSTTSSADLGRLAGGLAVAGTAGTESWKVRAGLEAGAGRPEKAG